MAAPSEPARTIVVGGGVFGAAAALALRRRGRDVLLLEAGVAPHPRASSTDISKLVRADYGTDTLYTGLMEQALQRWRQWNTQFSQPRCHFSGWVALSRRPLAPGTFEGDSFATLAGRGHPVEALDAPAIAARFPAWADAGYAAGYYNPGVAWAESGAVVAELIALARAAGVEAREHTPVAALERTDDAVTGVRLADGTILAATTVVVAAGAWTRTLVPWIADRFRVVAQGVFHVVPDDPTRFMPPAFPAFAADVGSTGWYGFPANAAGLVKIANHGVGVAQDADDPRGMPLALELAFDRFRDTCLPSLRGAPIAERRMCLYCDTFDGDLWIAEDPGCAGLVVAAGGSGHGFKFAPVLGDLIADAADRAPDRSGGRFAWRPAGDSKREACRAAERALAARWADACAAAHIPTDPALGEALIAAWSEPQRAYHAVSHLVACLDRLDAVRHLLDDPAAVTLALWFHDAVYDPTQRDNEERSAAWAWAALTDAGVPALADRVHGLVMATLHDAQPANADEALLIDIDLGVLGEPEPLFDRYDMAIRREYAHVPDAAYNAGRDAVLAHFEGRPRVFFTDLFHGRFEARARANLARARRRLRAAVEDTDG